MNERFKRRHARDLRNLPLTLFHPHPVKLYLSIKNLGLHRFCSSLVGGG
jgi:hypothetical protein